MVSKVRKTIQPSDSTIQPFPAFMGGDPAFILPEKPNIMKRVHLFIILLIVLTGAKNQFAQSPTQVIRGTVVDKQSMITLPGANVVILGSNPAKGASTGIDGTFRITGVVPGRYDVQATSKKAERPLTSWRTVILLPDWPKISAFRSGPRPRPIIRT
jgi:hypothetical protein